MILGIDPKVDYAFKHLLGRDATRPILIDVLDKVLNLAPGYLIQSLELLNPFNPKETLDDKLSILDIKARDHSGRLFNIEMQMLSVPHFEKRIVYYASRLHQQQLHEGQKYGRLKPTISISFLNHVLFPEVPDYQLRFGLRETKHHFPLTSTLEFHLLELPKFTKTSEELETGLEIWLYFLRHAAKMDTEAVPEQLQKPLVLKAFEELRMLTQSEIERERYEARWKAQLDHNSFLADAHEIGLEKGLEQGLEQGLEKGLEKGLEQGQKIGKIDLIHLCERWLKRPETPSEQLAALSLMELTRLAETLQGEVLPQH